MQKKEILEELVKCSQILYKEGDFSNFKKLVRTAQDVANEFPDAPNATNVSDIGEIFYGVNSNEPQINPVSTRIQEEKDREFKEEVSAMFSVVYSNIEVNNLAKAKEAFTKFRDYLREALDSSNIAVEFTK